MRLDNLKGLLWGAAVGDALGSPHEFRTGTPLNRYTGRLEYPVVAQSRWQGRRIGVVGQISDDTEMMIALADVLRICWRYEAERAAMLYLDWANSGCPFMGTNTRELFHGVKTLRGYESRHQKKLTSLETPSLSNGCLMRCGPLAALGEIDAVEAARLDCKLTNPHPICVDACQVFIRAACRLGQGEDPLNVRAAAPEWAETADVRMILATAADDDAAERDVTGALKGYILHALWCAFRSLKVLEETLTFEDTIDWVIRRGGDTDTNACIAGVLLGASLGYEVLSSEERTGENIRIARAADPSRGSLDRPRNYWASRIDGLAEALAII